MTGLVLSLVLNSGGVLSTPPPAPKPLHKVRLVANKNVSLHCTAFFPDSKTVVFGGGGPLGPGRLLFWDVKTGKTLHTHAEHKFAICSVAVSPDGKLVATGGGHGEVKVWNPDGKVVAHLDGRTEYTYSIAFSPDGKWLAHTGEYLVVRDTAKFESVPATAKEVAFGPYALFSPDGKTLMGTYPWGELNFRSVPECKKIGTHRTKVPDQHYFEPRYSPDGKTLAVHTSLRKKVKGHTDYVFTTEVWSVSGCALGKKRFEVPGHHLGMAFTPDGKYLLLGDMAEGERKSRICVWDVAAGREVASWVAVSEEGECVRDLAVSPDGTLLVSCADGYVGKVWDLKKILDK